MSRQPAVPAWVTDPDLIADIRAGLVDIPDDLARSSDRTETTPTIKGGDLL